MKKYAKLAAVVLCAVISLSLFAGCGLGALGGMIGEIEGQMKSGDGFVFGNEEGGIAIGDNLKWPKNDMNNIPEPKAKFSGVVRGSNPTSCMVTFSEMSNSDAEAYRQTLINLGYASTYDMNNSDGFMYIGGASDGSVVSFTYNSKSNDGMITFTEASAETASQGSDSAGTDNAWEGGQSDDNSAAAETTAGPVDMTDAAPWPAGFLQGVPELEGKISDVMNINNKDVYVYLEYVEVSAFNAYVNTIKNNGYNVDATEFSTVDSKNYGASNSAGDYINVFMSMSSSSNDVTIWMKKAD